MLINLQSKPIKISILIATIQRFQFINVFKLATVYIRLSKLIDILSFVIIIYIFGL